MEQATDLSPVFSALRFASHRHRDQRRKDEVQAPYVNLLIAVLDLLWDIGGVRDALAAVSQQITTEFLEADAATARHEERPTPESYRANELIGDSDQVLAVVEPMVEQLGLTDFVLNGPASGLDWRGEGFESVRSFAEEVLPRLKAL